MKRLDNFEAVKERIDSTDLKTVLFQHELSQWNEMPQELRDSKLRRVCSLPLGDDDFTVVNTLYFRLKWMDVLHQCTPEKGATVLEVGSGSSTNIPDAMTSYDTSSTYITANMNKKLTLGLRENTSSLPIKIEVIENDAMNIGKYLPANSLDAVVFEHSVNDVLQGILCERTGIDTTNNDWFDILPDMIKIIGSAYINDTLEQQTKDAFLLLIENCIKVLKPGGYLAMSHYMFQYDLDLGYNPELWENMLLVVRPWLKELTTVRETTLNDFDPQWWLFLRKL